MTRADGAHAHTTHTSHAQETGGLCGQTPHCERHEAEGGGAKRVSRRPNRVRGRATGQRDQHVSLCVPRGVNKSNKLKNLQIGGRKMKVIPSW